LTGWVPGRRSHHAAHRRLPACASDWPTRWAIRSCRSWWVMASIFRGPRPGRPPASSGVDGVQERHSGASLRSAEARGV